MSGFAYLRTRLCKHTESNGSGFASRLPLSKTPRGSQFWVDELNNLLEEKERRLNQLPELARTVSKTP